MQEPPPQAQSQQTTPQSADSEAPLALEDVVVSGAPLEEMIRDFVGEVAAPNRDRGIARWRNRVCVGVANLRAEAAQYIVDRVSTVAEDVGLRPGAPGCRPNIMIVATDHPDLLAEELVRLQPREFQIRGAGMDRGDAALRAFEVSDAPVRWWQISMPVNSDTGERATRISGECRGSCGATAPGMESTVHLYAPNTRTFAASRLSTQIVDDLFRTLVIVDANQVGAVSGQQLADYIAMVVLAQIDPEAETRRYATVLNVFESPATAEGLTEWDRAYLIGLYGAVRTRANRDAGQGEIVASIHRTHGELAEPADE